MDSDLSSRHAAAIAAIANMQESNVSGSSHGTVARVVALPAGTGVMFCVARVHFSSSIEPWWWPWRW